MGLADVTRQPGLLGERQMAKGPPQAHPPLGRGHGQATPGGQPGRRRAGAVGLPRPGGVEGGRGPGGHGRQTLEVAVQVDHRLTVAEEGGINLPQLGKSRGHSFEHTAIDRHRCTHDAGA